MEEPSEVRLSHFAFKHTKIIDYFFAQSMTKYSNMPILSGWHDYMPDCKRHREALKAVFSEMGMNYNFENTSICVYIIQTYGHKLPDSRDQKEAMLQGAADCLCNIYLNKRKVLEKEITAYMCHKWTCFINHKNFLTFSHM